jgi:hypothetical protein
MKKRNYSLVGVDGNAFSLMAYTKTAMKECGRSEEQIKEVLRRARSSDYHNLIAVLDDELTSLNNLVWDDLAKEWITEEELNERIAEDRANDYFNEEK